ncbi:MAG: DUF4442 domain-containing protein [Planctomycetes bacterium]|jgi:acyl-coenzyme A thioesterase PaaI-like protein|nr:DUF4442 domain-containing protein [Planctomycetota bacterium]HJO26915.1 YiiD C-terminal domain-containing protein [Planctomycetota bacterium]
MPLLRSRTLSPRAIKWILNVFPPLFFQRIRVREISDDFMSCRVVIKRSLLTRNLHGTTFGGTIFSAADSPLPIMLWQIFAHRGIQVESWLQAGEIHYDHPAATDLLLDFTLTEEEIAEAAAELEERGRFRRRHEILARDRNGQVCARVTMESYIRLPRGSDGGLSAF